ncbi:MAG TPA: hypothetical protein VNP72_03295, partial [Longimicrobium sp.]|nr:hypothetical protein [Longimicrobium sp.]
MRRQAILGAVLLLAAGGAPLHAQRDTIRIGGSDTVRIVRGDSTRPDAPAVRGDSVFDSPGTRDLVLRVIRTGTNVPAELADYRADMHAAIYLSLQSDTAQGGELPVTVDEVAGEVRWDRAGDILQTIKGHRVKLLAPAPYTVGSMLEAPWIVPHLYGNTINVFSLAATPAQSARLARAIHPFSYRGIDFYLYTTGDTVRVRTQEGATTLIPIRVRPRLAALSEARDYRLVAGTFWVDLDRAAVARARFGFVERSGRFMVTETGTFLELESALIGGRYWLPVRQRREIQISSPLVGGSAAIRVVTRLSRFDLNTGWRPETAGTRLVWSLGEGAFADWPGVGTDLAPPDIADFADLREQVRPPRSLRGTHAALRYESSAHLFRYNRVEGAFVGLGMRLEPRDPDRRDWHVYAHGGWAFAEGTPRGELSYQWHPYRDGPPTVPRWSATVGAYRRLRDMTSFRP